MPFAAALSLASDTARAVDEVAAEALQRLGGRPDLAVVFFSPHHADDADSLAATLQERLAPRAPLLGCVGESIVGADREVEGQPAVSLWLARWTDAVVLESFHLSVNQTPDGVALLGWPDGLVGVDPKQSALLVLGDPYTFPADVFLEQLNEEYAGLPVTGGMASGVRGPGECRLIRGGEVMPGGAVGVLLQGLPGLRTVVSQGCRPVGRAMVITRGQDNIITELGGKPPLARLQEMWQELDAADRNLVQQGLHLGLVINEYQGAFRRGDFLVRNVVGIDRDTGALAVTDRVRVGQTVQFHVRDAASADDDLRALLRADGQEHAGRPGGALLFTCNGRGTRMFPTPNHDVQALHQEIGAVPVAGFFAQGELGPVTGQNFMHGFTASVVLFGE
jgi:small ligand-binding sensory domain FIST